MTQYKAKARVISVGTLKIVQGDIFDGELLAPQAVDTLLEKGQIEEFKPKKRVKKSEEETEVKDGRNMS